jgi:hypothetical protein
MVANTATPKVRGALRPKGLAHMRKTLRVVVTINVNAASVILAVTALIKALM